ncbi:HD domain-containing protein [Flavisolibacter ginsenosidimutans]|uniref:HD domain-containing protein n=1 Tax=Flavisolibacter ginsenosidimutans TaxID=661481 RepID=A0A5B8UMR9_9BACT|nr:HD domain-containing protein [Flavisolibacter ginsenosidimutans]QEC57853.1 HD domain-containing protein [Flavisolibacter ginsenosidimutans]
MAYVRKIINDPVYGFITIDNPLIFEIISHPYYQRLRRIHQMAFASLVYPGAVHTRLHHSLGAYHLMGLALNELRNKGVEITQEEELGAKIAILLHDIGHGPYSHALERKLIKGVHHEDISMLILGLLNEQFNGQLQTAIEIFSDAHPKPFLHQLVSGQLDVDRMDYLTRDSFFTGVVEGAIGYDRIIKMLTVHNGELMVEEKAIFTVEKFLVSRRLMYWQVYLHKTVMAAEKMLVRIIERANELLANGIELSMASSNLAFFLKEHKPDGKFIKHLEKFAHLDDTDVMCTIKNWCGHFDTVLSRLSKGLVERKLLKIKFASTPFDELVIEALRKDVAGKLNISEAEASYFVFTGEAVNTTYNPADEHINILYKDGTVANISEVDNALIHQRLSTPVKKYYLCYLK